MVAEDIGLVTEHRMENGLNTQMVFQDESLQFNCGGASQGPDAGGKIREVGGIVGEKMFSIEGERYFATPSSEFRHMFDNPGVAPRDGENPNWHNDGSSDGSEGDDDDDDDDDEGDEEVEGLVGLNGGNTNDHGGSGGDSELRKDLQNHHHSSIGLSRGALVKDSNGVQCGNGIRENPNDQHHQQGRGNQYENAVAITEPDMYYSQFQQGPEGSALAQKEIRTENGCGFVGGKEASLALESNEPLRAILTDPITGTLMDDAMILPCGHSFGSGGMQHVIRMKACYTCSQSVTEDSVAPNLSLRSAIQAFRREEELHSYRVSKKRRERFEQDKSSCGDPFMYLSRGKGVQFPFAVTDRVIIKGNKRTPLRFVGREAVVTTQCLNGWYVVKTLDNAESVKLQYRSLAKVSDSPSSNMIPSKMTPHWL